jgi:hypothetical protein
LGSKQRDSCLNTGAAESVAPASKPSLGDLVADCMVIEKWDGKAGGSRVAAAPPMTRRSYSRVACRLAVRPQRLGLDAGLFDTPVDNTILLDCSMHRRRTMVASWAVDAVGLGPFAAIGLETEAVEDSVWSLDCPRNKFRPTIRSRPLEGGVTQGVERAAKSLHRPETLRDVHY